MKRFPQQNRDPRTFAIIGAAMEVHSRLGPGFLEAVYHRALLVELEQRGIPFVSEVELAVDYKGTSVGRFRADLVCFSEVVVELKAVCGLLEPHRNQVINYLKATGFRVGLLLNFGEPSLDFQRFANQA